MSGGKAPVFRRAARSARDALVPLSVDLSGGWDRSPGAESTPRGPWSRSLAFPFASARRRVAALVHPDARASGADRARHELFIFARLATIVLVAVLVPRYLAAVGADPLWRIGAFAWLLLPLAAVVHLARTGDLVEAQLISLFSLALLTCVVVIGARLSPEMSLGWLMLRDAPGKAAMVASALALLEHLGGLAKALIHPQVPDLNSARDSFRRMRPSSISAEE